MWLQHKGIFSTPRFLSSVLAANCRHETEPDKKLLMARPKHGLVGSIQIDH
jgi:hypothetical protein